MLITNHSQLREPQPHSTAYKLIEGIWRRLYPQNDLDEEGEMGALLSAKPGRGLGGGIDCDGSFRKRGLARRFPIYTAAGAQCHSRSRPTYRYQRIDSPLRAAGNA
jgi:hypothetical protein